MKNQMNVTMGLPHVPDPVPVEPTTEDREKAQRFHCEDCPLRQVVCRKTLLGLCTDAIDELARFRVAARQEGDRAGYDRGFAVCQKVTEMMSQPDPDTDLIDRMMVGRTLEPPQGGEKGS